MQKKEFTDTLRDGRFRWSGGILLVLLLASVIVGWRQYEGRTRARTKAQIAQREQWLNKTMTNPHVAAHSGTTVFRPYMPLSAIDNGLDAYLGTSVFLEPHQRNLFQQSPIENAPTVQRLGELTAAFILQLLAPLFIILSTFAAFAGEREKGTLRQILSLGVKPSDLALGKIIGVTAPLILLIILTTLICVPVLALSSDSTLLSSDLARMALMFFAYLAYFLIFLGLGLLVSALSRSSQRAFTVLLGFWFLTCLLMPRLAIAAAQRFYPTPTPEEFIEELEGAGDGVGFLEKRAQIEKRLLAKYGVKKAEDLPVSTWGVTLYEREVDSTNLYNKQFGRLFEQYEKQNRFYQKISLFAPPLAIQTLSMGLAGSDESHFRNFAEAVESYRYNMVQKMNQLAIESRLYNTSLNAPPDRPAFINGEREAYEQIGPFDYTSPSWFWALKQSSISVIALVLWLLAVAAILPRVLTGMRVE